MAVDPEPQVSTQVGDQLASVYDTAPQEGLYSPNGGTPEAHTNGNSAAPSAQQDGTLAEQYMRMPAFRKRVIARLIKKLK